MDKFLEKKGVFEYISSGKILDLGCGNNNFDIINFAERGFLIDAVDKDLSNISFIKKQKNKNINAILGLMEEFKPKPNEYSLIIVNNSLPFVSSKEKVKEIINNLSNALVANGFIYLTLFGQKDEWNKDRSMSFFTQEEGLNLLDNLGLRRYFISTEEGYGKTIKGGMKYWQIHKFLYRR
ncbi:MAG: class I SAM-dependent methyltransferase [Patescibacteria group bacterium]